MRGLAVFFSLSLSPFCGRKDAELTDKVDLLDLGVAKGVRKKKPQTITDTGIYI